MGRQRPPRVVRGFDTETYRGYVKLLAGSHADVRTGTGYLETPDTEELLSWLYTHGKDTHNVFWNVGYDLQCILKPWVITRGPELKALWLTLLTARARIRDLTALPVLTDEEAAELKGLRDAKVDRSIVDELKINDSMRIRYIHGKGFTLFVGESGQSTSASFYDASAFYRPDHANIKLDTAAKQYLHEGKNDEELGISAKQIGNERGYYEKHRDKIIPYCVQDASLTARLQALTIQAHADLGLPWPHHPWSKASVHKEYWRRLSIIKAESDNFMALYHESPWKGFWSASYHGGIFLVRHLGKFDAGWEADINSAYPWMMTLLRSLIGSKLVRYGSDEFDDADYQFYKIRLTPTPRVLDPTHKDKLLRYHFAVNPRELTVTRWDLDTLNLYGDHYEIIDGLGMVCDPILTEVDACKDCGRNDGYPFHYLQHVFDRKASVKKEHGKLSVLYNNIKVFANSGSGALAQRRPAESKWTNLIYASHITARIRHEIWRMCYELEKAGDNLISVKTDGITVEGTHARGTMLGRSTDALGGIEVDKIRGGVSFENGIYQVVEDDGREVFRHRGLRSKVMVPGSQGQTRKEVPLIDLLRQCPHPTLSVDRETPLSLVRAIIQERYEDLAIFEPDRHTIFPARAASRNFDFDADLFTIPLKDYFTDGWTLDWATHE